MSYSCKLHSITISLPSLKKPENRKQVGLQLRVRALQQLFITPKVREQPNLSVGRWMDKEDVYMHTHTHVKRNTIQP